jgi:UDPglucose 6-dehydrogenase
VLREIYRPLYLIETPVLITDVATAEMIKCASNAFLSVKISFINEIANLCDRAGADVHAVARGMGLDKRIGSKFLHAGRGRLLSGEVRQPGCGLFGYRAHTLPTASSAS